MSYTSCGCDCQDFLPDDWQYVANQYFANATHSFDGPCFGFLLTAGAFGAGKIECKITGISDTQLSAAVERLPGLEAGLFSELQAPYSLTLGSEAIDIINLAGPYGTSLVLSSCAVESQAIITASSQCSALTVAATPLSISWQEEIAGAVVTKIASQYASTTPKGVFGNECAKFEIYRDGQLLKFEIAGDEREFFESPDLAACTLEYSESEIGDKPAVSDAAGSYDDPISITGSVALPPGPDRGRWTAGFTPNVSGYIVAEWSGDGARIINGTYRQQPASFMEAYPVTKDQLFELPITEYEGLPAGSQMNVDKLYLIPDLRWHPFPNEVIDAISGQGSYFLVAKRSTSTPPEMIESTGRTASPTICYTSWVVCNEKYSAAAEQVNDSWYAPSFNVFATAVHRENPYSESTTTKLNFEQFPNGFVHPVVQPGFVVTNAGTFPVGEYAARASGFTPEVQESLKDVYGNMPLVQSADVHFQIHAVPQDNKRGATAKFIRPTRDGGDRSLVFEYPIQKLTVRFDKPVTGLALSMFEIKGNVPPAGAAETLNAEALNRVNGSLVEYEIEIPVAGQVPNSQWTITFTPGSDVGTFSPLTQTMVYGSRDQFPQVGEALRVYIDSSTGYDYVWAGIAYRRPINEDCEEFGTTKLACRFMWCMAKDKSVGRYLIDTTAETATALHSQASISTTKTPPGNQWEMTRAQTAEVTSSGLLWLQKTAKHQRFLSDAGVSDFIPRLPDDATTETSSRFSYFGIPTTIHPAKPAWIGNCAAPSVPQRHASLLFGASDVEELVITAEAGWTVTVSKSGMPQNFWSGTGSPNIEKVFPQKTSRNFWGEIVQQSRGKDVLVSVDVAIHASRGRLTYTELQTTSVTDLVLRLYVKSEVQRFKQIKNRTGCALHDENCGAWPGGWQATTENLGDDPFAGGNVTIIVPIHMEASLGQLMDTQGRMWTITKG